MSAKLIKITPPDLSKISVVAQTLDFSWVPVSLLKSLTRNNQSLQYEKIHKEKTREWRRALVYSEQVVIPFNFFLGEDVIINDFFGKHNRVHFKKLLNDKLIVPYLFKRNDLNPDLSHSYFDRDRIDAWFDTINDIEVSCVKFNWRSEKRLLQSLIDTFHEKILSLSTRSNFSTFLSNIAESQMIEFEMQVSAISLFAQQLSQQGKYVNRNELYKKFISAPGSNPAQLRFDVNRPFVFELKQLIDRIYHTNFADALGSYLLSPIEDFGMLFLENLSFDSNYPKVTSKGNRLSSFQKKAFGIVLPLLNTHNLGDLTLGDIFKIRDSEEWHSYLQKFHDLLDNSENYHQHLPELKMKIQKLNSHINKVFLN